MAHQGAAPTLKSTPQNHASLFCVQRTFQRRVSNETPSRCALAAVAPTVRFKAFDILVTPAFCFASDFKARTSDAVHARRIDFFLALVALAISFPIFLDWTACIASTIFAMQCPLLTGFASPACRYDHQNSPRDTLPPNPWRQNVRS